MNQYILETPDTVEAEALIHYLESLGYVQIRPLRTEREAAVVRMRSLLQSLPDQEPDQTEINNAIKQIRQESGYQ